MRKTIFLISLLAVGCWLIANSAAAQEVQSTNTQSVDTNASEEITTKDLGVENPGILPSNPFYFLKEWQREIKKILTFDPVKKVELELQYTNERVAEIKKLEEIAPSNIKAINNAISNYEKNFEQLKNRLEELKETSQNPNVDELLNKLIDRSLQHRQLFNNLILKFENQTQLKKQLEGSQEKINEMIMSVPQKFEKVENSLSPKIKEKIEAAKKIILDIKAVKKALKEVNEKRCTQEAKICPNGSSVGRTGPNCEFAICPAATSTSQ